MPIQDTLLMIARILVCELSIYCIWYDLKCARREEKARRVRYAEHRRAAEYLIQASRAERMRRYHNQ